MKKEGRKEEKKKKEVWAVDELIFRDLSFGHVRRYFRGGQTDFFCVCLRVSMRYIKL